MRLTLLVVLASTVAKGEEDVDEEEKEDFDGK